ncbi:MAG: glycerol-3-phosphate dehydrogenase/oxidase [bacterium]|nr:glycerol-3-phosphate dehydrogenase/oxidase [bacterium]
MNARAPIFAPRSPSYRDLQPLKSEVFDLIVIGGGITGASILRDASLRGLNAVLLERGDYASGTTQATSKLIHGGLRYLKNGEISLVRESLRERRTLARLAPHALRPEAFLFPVYSDRGIGRLKMGAALTAYDLLGFDRNRGVDAEHRLPGSRFLDAGATLAEEPGLDFRRLSGSYLYYDYANLNPERLCVEMILSARERGAIARNYTEVRRIARRADGGYEARVTDRRTGQHGVVRGRAVVNAGGPWADYLEGLVSGRPFGRKSIRRSKGVHLVTRRCIQNKTVVLMKADQTHLFMIPWRGRTLIGTTDTAFDEHPDRMRVTTDDARQVLSQVNALFPGAKLELNRDVEYFYGGLRPLLAGEAGQSSYDASRRMEILHLGDDRRSGQSEGFAGFFTVLGGKYTTGRRLAEALIDRVCDYLPGKFGEARSHRVGLPAGEFSTLTELSEKLERKFSGADPRKIRVLARRYGAVAERILDLASPSHADSGAVYRLGNGEVYYPEEIDYLVANEDVETASDLFFRRSGIGTVGPAPETVSRAIIDRMGKRLGWGRREKRGALQEIAARYRFPKN